MINRATRAKISVYDITLGGDSFSCRVAWKNVKTFALLLQEEQIEYTLEQTRFSLAAALKRRPFLIAGILIAFAMALVFGSFVYGVEITGNRYVNTSKIESVLLANKVDGFAYKGKVDVERIKMDVVALDGVSFASVKIKGSKLYVDVKEELPTVLPEDENYAPVLSACSGVVTKVVTESGTPCVKVGDTVRSGDVLIAPVYTFTEGESAAPAKGEVWAKTTYKEEIVLSEISVEKQLTGKVFRSRSVAFFGREILGFEDCPFSEYDLSETVISDAFGVRVTERLYREIRAATSYHDLDAEAPLHIEKALVELLSETPFYAYATGGVVTEQKKMDNMLYIVLYYTVEQRIDSLFLPNEK